MEIKAYLNRCIEDIDGEEWVDVVGYDGIYLVSNYGRIKSYQREVDMGISGYRLQGERIMKQQISKSNYHNLIEPSKDLKVTFCVDKKRKTYHVATLVGNAFVGTLGENEVYSKKDKVWDNNNADNLIILSKSNDTKLSYEKGNNLRKKKTLLINHKNQFIYTRLADGKEFTSSELIAEYKKEVRSTIKKSIKRDGTAYGSKWIRRGILSNPPSSPPSPPPTR